MHHVDAPDNSFEPYFVAICDTCSERTWRSYLPFASTFVGVAQATAEEAFADARTHSPNVSSEILRPLDPDYRTPAT